MKRCSHLKAERCTFSDRTSVAFHGYTVSEPIEPSPAHYRYLSDIVRFGSDEHAVDEAGVGPRQPDRLNDPHRVDVGDDDLFAPDAPPGSAAAELVAAFVDGRDQARIVRVEADCHEVAHGHRVGYLLVVQPKLTPHLRRHDPVVGLHVIPTPRRADHDATEEGAGFEVETNRVTILARDTEPEHLPMMSKDEVAEEILDRVSMRLG